MKFVTNLTKDEYISFFKSQENAHFLQSYEWGQTQQKARHLIPYYVGLKDDKDQIVAAALLLKKKTPLNMCYFYSPRGFIIDYKNKKIWQKFTKGLKLFLKDQNAIYLKVDPGVKYQDIDADANPVANGFNNYDIYDEFLNQGYKHTGFYKLYEGNQPRYTTRTFLKDKTMEEIDKGISKTFMNTIKRSYDYELEIKMGNEVKTMYELMQNNAAKDDFHSYTLDYYQNFYNEFSKENHVKIFNAIAYPDKIIAKNQQELEQLQQKIDNNEVSEKRKNDTLRRIGRLKKNIDFFLPYEGKYKDGKIICSLACSYTDYSSWLLYIGNDNIGMYTFAVNRCYYEALKDAKNNNLNFLDTFGTVGDPKTTYKNLAGLHEFKRKFGGEYIEFLGEFDLINKPVWYKILPILLKIYRKIKK